MKIVIAHTRYRQTGGEEQVMLSEANLLESMGHVVVRFVKENASLERLSAWRTAEATIWNEAARVELARVVTRERPDIVHFHNTFPLLSPAVYYAIGNSGAGVVQTLHNCRFICPGGLLARDGRVCHDCCDALTPPPCQHG